MIYKEYEIKIWWVGNEHILAIGKPPSRESPVYDQPPFNIFFLFFDNIGLIKYQISTKKLMTKSYYFLFGRLQKTILHVFSVGSNFISNTKLR